MVAPTLTEAQCRRNLFLYQIYVLFNEPLFWGPILITSLQGLAHMSLASIYFQESVVLCLCVLWDIPSGAIADLIGRRRTMFVGRLVLCGSYYSFATMTRPLDAWISNILWAIGFTMQSGADRAFLFDTLKAGGREKEYAAVEGKAAGNRYLLIAWCSLVTGYLASLNLRLPILLCLPFIALPLFATMGMRDPDLHEGSLLAEKVAKLQMGVSAARASTPVRWMIGFSALMATTAKVWFFMYNPYFAVVGLPFWQYGVVFFLLNIVASASSHYAGTMEEGLGERRCILLLIGCIALPVLIMAVFPMPMCAYLVLVQNVVRGFIRPFAGKFMHRHIPSVARATILSIESTAANLFSIVTLALFAALIAKSGVLDALLALGIGTLLLGGWSYRVYVKKIG